MTRTVDDEYDDAPPPQTHLDDDSYEEFLRREFDGRGRLRRGPAVGLWILLLVALLAGVAIVFLR